MSPEEKIEQLEKRIIELEEKFQKHVTTTSLQIRAFMVNLGQSLINSGADTPGPDSGIKEYEYQLVSDVVPANDKSLCAVKHHESIYICPQECYDQDEVSEEYLKTAGVLAWDGTQGDSRLVELLDNAGLDKALINVFGIKRQ